MAQYTEEQVLLAIQDIENGMKKQTAAKKYGIPRATLQRRLQGATSRKQRDSDQQLLSEVQERQLAQYIEVQDGLGTGLSHRQIRLIANRTLEAAGDHRRIGKHWITKFFSRY